MSRFETNGKTEVAEQKKTSVLVESTTNKETNIKNKGTGAGGSNTNKNGLSYEKRTDLGDRITIFKKEKHSDLIKFIDINNEILINKSLITAHQSNLFKYMKDEIDTTFPKAHGCKNPDECYIDKRNKNIFIIEKKFQQCGGSVCEKIQTAEFKRRYYNKIFPKYNVIYMYCLSDWYKENCKAELNDLKDINIPVFWGNSETYKDDIINFIINYK